MSQDEADEPLVGNGGCAMDCRLAMRVTIAAFATMETVQAQELVREHLGPVNGGWLGHSIAALADLDGDGVREYAVGDVGGSFHAGTVDVHSGATGTLLYSIQGSGSGTFGAVIADGGDRNGDGIADLLVGDPRFDDPNQSYVFEGAVRVHSGADGSLLAEFLGSTEDQELGSAVQGLDDLDGDGTPDILVRAYDIDGNQRYASAISGSDGGSIYTVDFDWVGAFRVGVDRDGDGVRDFVFGSNYCACGDGGSYALRAVSAASGAMLSEMFVGTQIEQLAEIGDLDGDAQPEVLVGGKGGSGHSDGGLTGDNDDSVGVVSLATGTGILAHVGVVFGSALGDEDGDGFDDYVVSSRSVGWVVVVSGRAGEVLYSYSSMTSGETQGLGDVDGDGLPDFVVGAPGFVDSSGVQRGRVSVYSGNDLWLNAELKSVAQGDYEVLTARGVPAANRIGIAVIDVSGVPMFQFLALGPADATEALVVEDTVPAGLSGLTMTFQSFAIGRTGRVVDSAPETITFL
jgi:hypothetical protein